VKRKNLILLCCITAIGAILRYPLINAGVDVDDVSSIYIAESSNLGELIERLRTFDFSPPLYFLILSAWIRMFGDTVLSVTIPSVVFGTGLVPCAYLLGKEVFEREDIALTGAFFVAVSPLAALFSREVRSSSLIALVATVAFYYLIKCLKATRTRRLVGLGVSVLVMLYTSYLGLLLVALMVLNTVAYTRFPFKSVVFKPRAILCTIGGALLCFAPWVPVFIEQQKFSNFWSSQDSPNNPLFLLTSNLAATLPLPWNAAFILLSFLLPIAAIAIIWRILRLIGRRDLINYIDHHKAHAFLLFNLLVPILAYAQITPVIGSQRYMMSFVVFGLIFWASLFVAAEEQVAVRLAGRSTTKRTMAVTSLAIMLITITFIEIRSLSSGERSGLRLLARDFKAKKFKHSAVLVIPDFDSYTLIYYLTREQKANLPSCYNTYPVANTFTPSNPRAALQALNDKESVDKVFKWLERIDVSKVQKLVVVCDQTEPFAKPLIVKKRTEELLEHISARYPEIGQKELYYSKGRTFAAVSFRLADPPD
jgi:hypothetical protein